MVVRGLIVLAVTLSAAAPARASDFWDEVRTPGLRTYRHTVAEARAELRARRYHQAVETADAAIALLADRAPAYVIRGRGLGEVNRGGDAVAAFRRALEIDERALDEPEDGAHAAQIAAYAGDHQLAATILSRVLGRMGTTSQRRDLYVLYGDVLLTLGPERLRDAVLAFREALRAGQSSDVRAALGLSLALRRAGELAEAEELARQTAGRGRVDALLAAIPVPPAERAARRAVAMAANGDIAGARQAWTEARQSDVWSEHAQTELERLAQAARPPASRSRH